jgi:hypothetical protein
MAAANGKASFFFSHDYHARNDEKVLTLRAEHGMKGYGTYWALVEMLYEASEARLSRDLFAGCRVNLGLRQKEFDVIIETCLRVGLFQGDEKAIWSNAVIRRREHIQNVRELRRSAGLASGQARAKDKGNEHVLNTCSTGVEQNRTEKRREEEIREDTTPPLPPQGGVSVAFETFWKTSPRKTGKASASRSFERAVKKGVPAEKIIAAVETHKRGAGWKKDNGQFIPHPTTWLNQGRWDDEVVPDQAPNPYRSAT